MRTDTFIAWAVCWMSTGGKEQFNVKNTHLRRWSTFPSLLVVTHSIPPSCRALLGQYLLYCAVEYTGTTYILPSLGR